MAAAPPAPAAASTHAVSLRTARRAPLPQGLFPRLTATQRGLVLQRHRQRHGEDSTAPPQKAQGTADAGACSKRHLRLESHEPWRPRPHGNSQHSGKRRALGCGVLWAPGRVSRCPCAETLVGPGQVSSSRLSLFSTRPWFSPLTARCLHSVSLSRARVRTFVYTVGVQGLCMSVRYKWVCTSVHMCMFMCVTECVSMGAGVHMVCEYTGMNVCVRPVPMSVRIHVHT